MHDVGGSRAGRGATAQRGLSLGAALLLNIGLIPPTCLSEHACGNGVVDDGEACDDGNATNGDGCDASCAPDDDVNTPGDDRAGTFVCTNTGTGVTITCPPGTTCCANAEPRCERDASSCADPFVRTSCDGPEDCAEPGEYCVSLPRGTIACTSTGSGAVHCHTDDDCAHVLLPYPVPEDVPDYLEGTCDANGVCDLHAPPALVHE